MKKNNINKRERGAIALYTMLACMFFTFIIAGKCYEETNRMQVQEQEIQQIHDNYLRNVEIADQIYQEMISIKVRLTRGEETGGWQTEVELTGTGESQGTSKIVAYTFSKDSTDSSTLTWNNITPTISTEQKTKVTESGDYYFWVKDDKENTYHSNKITIGDVDGTGPIVGTLIAKKNNSSGEEYKYDTWTSSNVYVEKVDGRDDESGHKRTTYTVKKNNILIYSDIEEPKILTEEGIYTITVTTENNAGLKVTSEPYIIKISRTVPTLALKHNSATGEKYTSGQWTKDDLYGEINMDTSATGKTVEKYQYSYDGENWKDISGTQVAGGIKFYNYTKTGNKVTFMLKDDINKEIRIRAIYSGDGDITAETEKTSIKIDKTPPTATLLAKKNNSDGETYEYNTWTNTDVYISLIDGTDSGSGYKQATYTVKKDSATLYENISTSITLKEEGIYTIIVTAEDYVGNISTNIEYIVKISKAVPVLSLKHNSSTGTVYGGEWTKDNLYGEINMDTSSTGKTVEKYQYSYDGVNWKDVSANQATDGIKFYDYTKTGNKVTFMLKDQMNKQIYIRAVYSDGDISGESDKSTIRIDKTPPKVGTLIAKENGTNGNDYTLNTWTNANIYLSVNNGSDNESGHKKTTFTVKKGSTILYENIETEKTLSGTGTYTVTVTTEDNAGNISTSSEYIIKIDQIKPTVGKLIIKKNNSSGVDYVLDEWTNSDIYVAKTDGSDNESGHKKTTYSILSSTGSYQVSSGLEEPTILTEHGIYYLTVTTEDNAGNSSTETYGFINIDKKAPTIEVGEWGDTYQTSDGVYHRTAMINYEDEGSGLKGRYLSTTTTQPTTASTWTSIGEDLVLDSGKTYYLWAIDKVGNISNMTTIVVPGIN